MGRVLLGKYYANESFLDVSDKTTESHGWRGILIGRDLIKPHIGWTVGDGKSIELWQDHWLSTTTQLSPMGPAPEHLAKLKVSDLIDQNRGDWDVEKIQAIIPHALDTILKIKISKTGASIWLNRSSGENRDTGQSMRE